MVDKLYSRYGLPIAGVCRKAHAAAENNPRAPAYALYADIERMVMVICHISACCIGKGYLKIFAARQMGLRLCRTVVFR